MKKTAFLLLSACFSASAFGSVLLFDSFLADLDAAYPDQGVYRGTTASAGNAALGDPAFANLSQAGGPIIGFTASAPWTAVSTYHRVHTGSLINPSRVANDLNGSVLTLNFWGGSRNQLRAVLREIPDLTPSSTYYMGSTMAVRWTTASGNTEVSSGDGIGWLYNGFGDALIARDGLVEVATYPVLPAASQDPEIFQGLQWGFRVNDTNDSFDLVLRGRNPEKDAIIEHVMLSSDQVFNFGADAANTYFVGLKVNINPNGIDEVTYWVNPDFSLTEPAGGTTVYLFDAFDSENSITHFGALTRGIRSQNTASTGVSGRYDDIALGTTWEAIVIPEPGTYALWGGLSALGLCLLIRRRGNPAGSALKF
jgi:hypothetical protein